MIVTDRYDHVIDDKGRLAIPSQIRSAMDPQIDGTAFVVLPESRYLQLIPEKLFNRLAGFKEAGLALTPEEAKVRRIVGAMSCRLEPDKAGRVVIPDRFLLDAKAPDPLGGVLLGRDVAIVGAIDRLELWNRADFIAHMRELMHDRPNLQTAMKEAFGAPRSAV